MVTGTCKLTGDVGPLVKAHILPAALTSPYPAGLPFAQAGRDSPPIKRWTSWYDPTIVTRVGEDILEEYDTWAVEELRRHKLVWSGWGTSEKLISPDFEEIPGAEDYGVRTIERLDGNRLRLFFLSLLWRAAVSDMPEFKEIVISTSEVRRLRRMLVERDPLPLHHFPMTLIQLSTKGDIHNLTPLAQDKLRDGTNASKGTIPIFRFYLDGLIVHFHRRSNAREVAALTDLLVADGKHLLVSTVKFEASWQLTNMNELVREAEERWPDRLARIPGFGGS